MKNFLLSVFAIFLSTTSISAFCGSPFSYDYKLHGPIIGYVSVPGPTFLCYVAVSDATPSQSSRNGKYHAANNQQTCELAKSAFYLGQEVYLWGEVKEGNNIVSALELDAGDVSWWDNPTPK